MGHLPTVILLRSAVMAFLATKMVPIGSWLHAVVGRLPICKYLAAVATKSMKIVMVRNAVVPLFTNRPHTSAVEENSMSKQTALHAVATVLETLCIYLANRSAVVLKSTQ